MVDALHGANWQRGGGKGQRPAPVPRPGERAQRDVDEETAARHRAWFKARAEGRL